MKNWWIDETYFKKVNNRLEMNGRDLEKIARDHGTPIYVYSIDKILHNYDRIKGAMDKYASSNMTVSIHYAMKANSNPEVMRALEERGSCIGSASLGEVLRAKECGFDSRRIIFTAPTFGLKNYQHLVESGVLFNIENFSQIKRLKEFGPLDVSIRHNPGINGVGFNKKYKMSGEDIQASRLGIYTDRIIEAFETAREVGLNPVCLHQHVGSNWTDVEQVPVFLESVRSALDTVIELEKRGFEIKTLNLGGGPGVKSHSTYSEFPLEEYAKGIWETIAEYDTNITELSLEPGRFIVDNAGVLLAEVNVIETKNNVQLMGIDSGFNMLHHVFVYGMGKEICNVTRLEDETTEEYVVGGYLGEQSDIFFEAAKLPTSQEEDIVALFPAGGYCASELAFHHLLPHPREVILHGDTLKVKDIRYKQEIPSAKQEKIS